MQKIIDSLNGRPVLVVSAGPGSLHWRKLYENLNKHYNESVALITVKNSEDLVNEVVDVHFVNSMNLRKIKGKPKYTVMTALPDRYYFGKYDYVIYLKGDYFANEKIKDQLLLNPNSNIRPMGYGIMVEIVIPLLVAANVKSIHTIGWDIGSPSGENTQYDGSNWSQKTYSIIKNSKCKIKKIVRLLHLTRFSKTIQYSFQKVAYEFGFTVFRGTQSLNECIQISQMINYLGEFCEAQNIPINIHSNSEWMQNKYRVSLSE